MEYEYDILVLHATESLTFAQKNYNLKKLVEISLCSRLVARGSVVYWINIRHINFIHKR